MDIAQAAALRSALAGLIRRPAGAPSVAECLDQIEQLGVEVGGKASPQLRHYLTNRSYEKALLLLEEASGVPVASTSSVEIGNARLELVRGDITHEATDAIANAANAELAGGGGVDGAIHRAGGPAIMAELRERYNGCPVGSAVVTAGGKLAARFVLHAVGPRYAGSPEDADMLESAYQTCLILCDQNHLASVAFPSISTGIYGYPVDEAATIALKTVAAHFAGHEFPSLVRFVLFDDATFSAYAKALEHLAHAEHLPHEHAR